MDGGLSFHHLQCHPNKRHKLIHNVNSNTVLINDMQTNDLTNTNPYIVRDNYITCNFISFVQSKLHLAGVIIFRIFLEPQSTPRSIS